MAATARDIRAYETQRDEAAAVADPVAPGPVAIAPPLPMALRAPAPSRTMPLGATLPPIRATTPTLERASSGIMAEHENLNNVLPGQQAAVEERRRALASELDQPLPQAPKLHAVPQFQPRQVSGEELTLFMGVTMALAGLGTKAMRGDLTMALNAAGNAMKGFNEGNLQQSKLDLENFKRQMDSVIAENSRMSEEYRSVIESRKLSLSQKEQALRVVAASRDDQIMLSALKSGQLRQVFDLEASRIDATNKVRMHYDSMYQSASQHIERMNLEREQIEERRREREANQPLEPVLQADGTVRYVPRNQAAGGVVPPRNSGDRLTESEGKATLFWRQMQSAEEAAGAAAKVLDMSSIEGQLGTRAAGYDLTNWLAPDKAQQYAQAQEQWAEAYLRLKTGAATNRDEIQRNARAYFPQPGDSAAVIAQKNDMRRKAIADVSIVAGRGVDRQPGGGARRIANDAEYNALPSGAEFIAPDGSRRRKP